MNDFQPKGRLNLARLFLPSVLFLRLWSNVSRGSSVDANDWPLGMHASRRREESEGKKVFAATTSSTLLLLNSFLLPYVPSPSSLSSTPCQNDSSCFYHVLRGKFLCINH